MNTGWQASDLENRQCLLGLFGYFKDHKSRVPERTWLVTKPGQDILPTIMITKFFGKDLIKYFDQESGLPVGLSAWC